MEWDGKERKRKRMGQVEASFTVDRLRGGRAAAEEGEDRKNLRGQGSDGRVEDSSERGHGARLKRAKGGGETWRAWN